MAESNVEKSYRPLASGSEVIETAYGIGQTYPLLSKEVLRKFLQELARQQ
jgi:hypothetical protein